MTVFVDASALIAIIAGEPDATELSDRLENDRIRLCSALSVWETVAGLCLSYKFTASPARDHEQRFLAAANMQFVGIGAPEFDLAFDAYGNFGKGRHPAALNMGDCYAYACTKSNRAKLPFKGEEFKMTDIAVA